MCKNNKYLDVKYYENGNIKLESYYLNNRLHQENGPAYIKHYKNGNIELKVWCLNGKWHREDGPAYIEYFKNGNVNYNIYYINDKRYFKNQFIQEMLKRKIQLF